jgi:hypothetical protein
VTIPASPAAISSSVPGSGVVIIKGPALVSVEKFFKVVVPSRFTSTVTAKPSVVSLVSVGIVPAASENMLNAKELPEEDVPSGEVSAGPNKLTSNVSVAPYVKPVK